MGLAAAVFGPLMNITGSILASWWHNRQPKGVPVTENENKEM
jgi:BASS family bile acid:Na+ symporter